MSQPSGRLFKFMWPFQNFIKFAKYEIKQNSLAIKSPHENMGKNLITNNYVSFFKLHKGACINDVRF